MYNVDIKREGRKLHIIIDLAAEGRPSRTGRSQVIASTEGNVELLLDGQVYRLGLNLFKPQQGRKRQVVTL